MNLMQQSIFVRTFGASPKIKVLDFLLDNRNLDWSKSDIAEKTGISRVTLDIFFSDLAKQKIIVKTREIGRASLYKLNKGLPIVQKLIELDVLLTKKRSKVEVLTKL